MSINRPLNGFRLVEVRYGDTVQEVAARELDDASRWRDIVSINDLIPPYLTGDAALAGARVKLYGQMLMVPAVAAIASAETDEDAVFGVDLDLADGLLSAVGGDFKLVSGRENLKQALSHRVRTHLRELLYHLAYGCGAHRLVGRVTGGGAAQLGVEYVRGALLSDPRVASVASVAASPSGDVMPVEAVIRPIIGSPIEVSL